MTSSKLDFADGFVLAGGSSTRMGRDKSSVVFGGTTLLDRAISSVAEVFASNFVVLNTNQPLFACRLPLIRDRFSGSGAAAGFDAAFSASKNEWCFFLAVDLPFVNNDAIRTLAAELDDETDAVVPRQADGRLQPLAAFYRRRTYAPIVEQKLRNGQSPSLRQILAGTRVREIDARLISPFDDLFHNVNTPEDIR